MKKIIFINDWKFAGRDVKILEAWEKGTISHKQALKQLQENGAIFDENITKREFEDYVRTLGYDKTKYALDKLQEQEVE